MREIREEAGASGKVIAPAVEDAIKKLSYASTRRVLLSANAKIARLG